jgi:acyl-CoA thioester hydrolase
MSPPRALTPFAGHFDGHAHLFAVRVYYEDTDFSGIVYHASYVRFMERARSDMLACIGIDQRRAWDDAEGAYAIADLTIKYLAPARFKDALTIVSTVKQLGAASLSIAQNIWRGDDHLIAAQVRAAFLDPSGKPRRQPKPWTAAYARVMATP